MSNKDNNHIVDVNKKISSVEWLKSTLITRQNTHIVHGEEIIFISLEKLNKLFEQANAMHKEEMVKFALFFSHAQVSRTNVIDEYNETFGGDNEQQ